METLIHQLLYYLWPFVSLTLTASLFLVVPTLKPNYRPTRTKNALIIAAISTFLLYMIFDFFYWVYEVFGTLSFVNIFRLAVCIVVIVVLALIIWYRVFVHRSLQKKPCYKV